MQSSLNALLEYAVSQGASDVHLRPNERPRLRILGELLDFDGAWDSTQSEQVVQALLGEKRLGKLSAVGSIDFAYQPEAPGLPRIRMVVFREQRGLSATLRLVRQEVPNLNQLGFNQALDPLIDLKSGLICITGSAGSGKSTTLAALIHAINQRHKKHIITLEDPVEFLHQNNSALITQRALLEDTPSFHEALKDALRSDPDVILVGELRDRETVTMALMAAQSGHLVLTSLHTASAVGTLNRLISYLPAAEQAMAIGQLADSLQAIVAQHLLLSRDRQQLILAYEMLRGTVAVRNIIRQGDFTQIQNLMQAGRAWGMQTLAQHIQVLLQSKDISQQTARGAVLGVECSDA